MKFLDNLKAEWKAKTTAEKIKTVLSGICDIGSGLLLGYLNDRLIPDDEKRWKRAMCHIASIGLGGAIGKMASDGCNDLIDAVFAAKEDQDA